MSKHKSETRSNNVTSIVAELERRQLVRARQLAERTHRREIEVMLESYEATRELESSDIEGMLADFAGVDGSEAAEARARLRCMRAARSCVRGDDEAGLAEWAAVMAEYPREAVPYVMRARWWLEHKKDPERAIEDLDRAATIEPNEATVYFWRGRSHELLDDADRALANYRRAAALDPTSVDILHALAKSLSAHGKPEEARAAWNRLIAVAPGYVDFHLGRARLLDQEGAHAAALADYERVVALAPDDLVARFSRALSLSLVGRLPEAADDMEWLCAASPEEPHYLRAFGDMRIREGRPGEALAPLTRVIELDPTAEGFALRGRAHRDLGNASAALADFERSLELDPVGDLVALDRLNLLVTAFPSADVRDRVLAGIDSLAASMPDLAPIAALQAEALAGRGDHAGALAAWNRAIEHDPDADGQTYLDRAIAHARLDHVQDAFDDATRAIEREPGLAAAYIARGIYRTVLEDNYVAALEDLDKGVALGPNDASGYYQRSNIHWNMSEYDEALAELDKAISCAPQVGQFYFERALCRKMLDDEPEGILEANLADYEEAFQRGYREPDVFLHKAIDQQELGDFVAALVTLDAAAGEHPGSGAVFDARAHVKAELEDEDGARIDGERAKELGFEAEDGTPETETPGVD